MYDGSDYDDDDAFFDNPDNHDAIEFKAWDDGWAGFKYDTQADSQGTPSTTNHKYRAVVRWNLFGTFDYNGDQDTYLRFHYELYYTTASSKTIVASSTLYIRVDTTYNGYIQHTVSTPSTVATGKTLYFYAYFKGDCDNCPGSADPAIDFNTGSYHMEIDWVLIYKYVYYSGPYY
jgi:hypothetical protein